MPSRKTAPAVVATTAPAPTSAIAVEMIQPPTQTPKEVLLTPNETVSTKRISKKKKTVDVVVSPPVQPEPVEIPVETNVIVDEPIEDVVEDNLEEDSPVEKKRTRRVVTKESLRNDFDNLFTEYTEEISSVKKRGSKKPSLEKYLHKLQTDVYRLLKIRPNGEEKKNRTENNNSGFMKPVKISPELAKFINVSAEDPITRVLITKKICEYIKEKDLQNPSDRREILPDESLRRIFQLTDNESEPLTYYSIQKKIQSHISKI
jgi:upstream activation factor subunit UAF30